jgi:hypothetical protein
VVLPGEIAAVAEGLTRTTEVPGSKAALEENVMDGEEKTCGADAVYINLVSSDGHEITAQRE